MDQKPQEHQPWTARRITLFILRSLLFSLVIYPIQSMIGISVKAIFVFLVAMFFFALLMFIQGTPIT